MEISLGLGFLDKSELIALVPRYCVGISVKGVTTPLTLRTRRRSNNKQKARTATTDVSLQKQIVDT